MKVRASTASQFTYWYKNDIGAVFEVCSDYGIDKGGDYLCVDGQINKEGDDKSIFTDRYYLVAADCEVVPEDSATPSSYKVVTKTTYITTDGAEHATPEAAEAHAKELAEKEEAVAIRYKLHQILLGCTLLRPEEASFAAKSILSHYKLEKKNV